MVRERVRGATSVRGDMRSVPKTSSAASSRDSPTVTLEGGEKAHVDGNSHHVETMKPVMQPEAARGGASGEAKTKPPSTLAKGEARNPETIRRIQTLFNTFDYDGDGVITRGEMKAVLMNLSQAQGTLGKLRERDIDLCMEEADKNKNGVIDVGEFFDWLMTPCCRVVSSEAGHMEIFDLGAVLRPLWCVYDRNGDGRVSLQEFEECFCILKNSLKLSAGAEDGTSVDPAMLAACTSQHAFCEADCDGSRTLDFDEFVSWQRKALKESGLLSDDLVELVPALARQLRRVFRLYEADSVKPLEDTHCETLQCIINNIAKYTRDIWNDKWAAHSTVRDISASGRHHFTNRWTEPRVGMNMDTLKRFHASRAAIPTRNIMSWDLHCLCVPEEQAQMKADEEECTVVAQEKRKWFACVQGTIKWKSGSVAQQKPEYYFFEDMKWCVMTTSDAFDTAYAGLPPELRLFCHLKTQANFGVKMTWSEVKEAMDHAVTRDLLTEEQLREFIESMEAKVMKTIRSEGRMEDASDEASRERVLDTFCNRLALGPRDIMAALSGLGFYRVSSVWADFMYD